MTPRYNLATGDCFPSSQRPRQLDELMKLTPKRLRHHITTNVEGRNTLRNQ